MRIVVSPTAFKGTLSAREAAEAIAEGVRDAAPRADAVSCPVADGGDGTLEVLVEELGGEVVETTAMGPLGRPVQARFGWLPGDIAVVELASASGLALVSPEKRDPLHATTRGTGDLIATALERLPRTVVVGMGGSATNDGGAGIAEAIGVMLLDKNGAGISPGAAGLGRLDRIDLTRLDPNLEGVGLIAACDVSNPLLGPRGAARVFAPQKGASQDEVTEIEDALAHFAAIVRRDTGIGLEDLPRAGAAGGAAGGMHALLGAELRDGFDVVAEAIGFDAKLEGADLLIVGEGTLDDQSLAGKASIAAARRARDAGIPVCALAGRITVDRAVLEREGVAVTGDMSELLVGASATSPAQALRRATALTLGGWTIP